MSEWVNEVLGPILKTVFDPINEFLTPIFEPWARVCTVGFFVGTMIWVFLGLKKEYVNLEAPSNKFWYDLRIWTVVSMLPHVVVYLSF